MSESVSLTTSLSPLLPASPSAPAAAAPQAGFLVVLQEATTAASPAAPPQNFPEHAQLPSPAIHLPAPKALSVPSTEIVQLAQIPTLLIENPQVVLVQRQPEPDSTATPSHQTEKPTQVQSVDTHPGSAQVLTHEPPTSRESLPVADVVQSTPSRSRPLGRSGVQTESHVEQGDGSAKQVKNSLGVLPPEPAEIVSTGAPSSRPPTTQLVLSTPNSENQPSRKVRLAGVADTTDFENSSDLSNSTKEKEQTQNLETPNLPTNCPSPPGLVVPQPAPENVKVESLEKLAVTQPKREEVGDQATPSAPPEVSKVNSSAPPKPEKTTRTTVKPNRAKSTQESPAKQLARENPPLPIEVLAQPKEEGQVVIYPWVEDTTQPTPPPIVTPAQTTTLLPIPKLATTSLEAPQEHPALLVPNSPQDENSNSRDLPLVPTAETPPQTLEAKTLKSTPLGPTPSDPLPSLPSRRPIPSSHVSQEATSPSSPAKPSPGQPITQPVPKSPRSPEHSSLTSAVGWSSAEPLEKVDLKMVDAGLANSQNQALESLIQPNRPEQTPLVEPNRPQQGPSPNRAPAPHVETEPATKTAYPHQPQPLFNEVLGTSDKQTRPRAAELPREALAQQLPQLQKSEAPPPSPRPALRAPEADGKPTPSELPVRPSLPEGTVGRMEAPPSNPPLEQETTGNPAPARLLQRSRGEEVSLPIPDPFRQTIRASAEQLLAILTQLETPSPLPSAASEISPPTPDETLPAEVNPSLLPSQDAPSEESQQKSLAPRASLEVPVRESQLNLANHGEDHKGEHPHQEPPTELSLGPSPDPSIDFESLSNSSHGLPSKSPLPEAEIEQTSKSLRHPNYQEPSEASAAVQALRQRLDLKRWAQSPRNLEMKLQSRELGDLTARLESGSTGQWEVHMEVRDPQVEQKLAVEMDRLVKTPDSKIEHFSTSLSGQSQRQTSQQQSSENPKNPSRNSKLQPITTQQQPRLSEEATAGAINLTV